MGQLLDIPEKITPEMEKRIKTVNDALPIFSESLMPSTEYTRNGMDAINLIFDHLHTNRKDIDRLIVSGSMGDRIPAKCPDDPPSFLICPDFDIVIFLNIKPTTLQNSDPPFQIFLDEFKKLLLKKKKIQILFSTPNSICVDVKGYKIEIFPAINCRHLVPETSTLHTLNGVKLQQNEVLEIIKGLANPAKSAHHFSASLSESSVAFVRSQPALVQSIIRLAKFWNSQIKLKGHLTENNSQQQQQQHVSNRSHLIECVSIAVVNSCPNLTVFEAAEKFLKVMAEFSSLIFVFEPQTSAIMGGHGKFYASCKDFRAPLVLDPVNPYHNLAWLGHDALNPETKSVISQFEKGAQNSLRKLRKFKTGEYTVETAMDVVKIFDSTVEQGEEGEGEESSRVSANGNNYWFSDFVIGGQSSNNGESRPQVERQDGGIIKLA